MQSQDPLRRLPEQLVYRIFEPFFRSEFINFILVSKYWQKYFQPPSQLWKDICLGFRLDESAVDPSAASRWLEKRASVVQRLRVALVDKESGTKEAVATWLELAEALQRADVKVLDVRERFLEPVAIRNTTLPALWETTSPSLESLTISSNSEALWLSDIDYLSGLTGLQQLFVDARLSGRITGFPPAILAFTELRQLALRISGLSIHARIYPPVEMVFLPSAITCLAKLQDLELETFQVQHAMLTSLTNLTSLKLKLQRGGNLEADSLKFPSQIRQLNLGCGKVPLAVVACTALTRLELTYSVTETEGDRLNRILSCLSELRRLSLDSNLGFYFLPAILSLRKLQVLDLPCADDIEGDFWSLMEQEWVTQLQALRIGWLPELPENLVRATKLEILDTGLGHLDRRQAQLLVNLPRLRQVHLHERRGADPTVIAEDAMRFLLKEASRLVLSYNLPNQTRPPHSAFTRMHLEALPW